MESDSVSYLLIFSHCDIVFHMSGFILHIISKNVAFSIFPYIALGSSVHICMYI